jgi:hypothetical protein
MRPALLLALASALGCRPGPAAPPQSADRPDPAPSERAPAPSVEPTYDPTLESAAAEREAYDRAIATALSLDTTCRTDPTAVQVDALVEAYHTLAPYEQSPERDDAIRALERCRQAVSGAVEKSLPGGKDPDFTAELETAIRKANARSAKNLVVTVEGSKVTIHKKGSATAGKKKPKKKQVDEKRELDGYCAMTSAPTVTRITVVTDEHGEMSCSPKFEFSKQSGYVDRRLGVAEPFELESTAEKKIPAKKP